MGKYKEQLNNILGKFQSGGEVPKFQQGGYSKMSLDFLKNVLYKGKGYSDEQAIYNFDIEYAGGKVNESVINKAINDYYSNNLKNNKVVSSKQENTTNKQKPVTNNKPQQTTIATSPNIQNSTRSNVFYQPPTPYEFSVVNPNAVSEYELQHYNDKTKSYDGVSVNDRLAYYEQTMPDLFNSYFKNKDGNYSLKDGKTYADFQRGYNEFIDETNTLFENEYGFDKNQLLDYRDRIKFTTDKKDTARGVDNKFGQFTSTRSGYQRNVVTPEQLELLKKEGIFTGRGVLNNPDKAKKILGDEIYNDAILGLDKYKNADYIIGTINKDTPPAPVEKNEENQKDDGLNPYENKQTNFTNNLPILTPDQSNLAPKYFGTRLRGIRAPWNVANFVSPESTIREINRQSNTARELLTSSNPYTSASAIANIQAQENQNIANSVYQTEMANQQAQNQTDNINEQRVMQTDLANNQESSAYENRSNVGLDNYYKEWLNYTDRRNKERMVNYNLQNQVNAVNAVNPNYNIGMFGQIYQTPEEFKIMAGQDGNIYQVDKNGKATKVETTETVGNKKTTTTVGDNRTNKKQEGGFLNNENFREFLRRNKKG